MANYSVTIKESSIELTAKQRIALKDTTSAKKLDEVTQIEPIVIFPDMWAVLEVHNDKSDNPVYENYIIVDESGEKYVTGSQSFWTAFMDIYADMRGEDEKWGIKVYRVDSKNYKGKQFLTCSIE